MSEPIKAWMLKQRGKACVWFGVHHSRKELIKQGGLCIPSSDYERLGNDSDRWKFAKKHYGFSIVRVTVQEDGP